ncbi:uncharacterized protein EDB91DRAFT_1340407 [Suillus paluster]|uniref:uncharacterized protein n=1 Tax=Suillus paluster TaxID=48578 RepID=UPI001B8771CE|nr:uncharacterized protein EDB91DRAFT_1340407 [Suillus paluster]KAG1722546.1 hypothetical protein EDB91DRAFT_1340407 [Suillus paluster]
MCPFERTGCCMAQLLRQQEDFRCQVSMLEQCIKDAGHECIFLLKFHCELKPIEMYWGWCKYCYCQIVKSNFAAAKKAAVEVLDSCPAKIWTNQKSCRMGSTKAETAQTSITTCYDGNQGSATQCSQKSVKVFGKKPRGFFGQKHTPKLGSKAKNIVGKLRTSVFLFISGLGFGSKKSSAAAIKVGIDRPGAMHEPFGMVFLSSRCHRHIIYNKSFRALEQLGLPGETHNNINAEASGPPIGVSIADRHSV